MIRRQSDGNGMIVNDLDHIINDLDHKQKLKDWIQKEKENNQTIQQ